MRQEYFLLFKLKATTFVPLDEENIPSDGGSYGGFEICPQWSLHKRGSLIPLPLNVGQA